MSSYLFVCVETESSAVTNCSCGVPQGCVLGPLFFVVYISPLACLTHKFGVLHNLYADDTQLFVALSKNCVSDIVNNIQNCLSTWFS